jgi:hypothetical protein
MLLKILPSDIPFFEKPIYLTIIVKPDINTKTLTTGELIREKKEKKKDYYCEYFKTNRY